jgi:predicted nuclease of predicted toxin-antitoxin system
VKIKLDENMPTQLTGVLASLGHDVEKVVQGGMAGCPDRDIWERVQQEGRFLITQGLDFSDVGRFGSGKHHGLLLVRLLSPGGIIENE